MAIFPFIKRHYITELQTEEIKSRIEHHVAKPDKHFTFQKAADNRILEGKITEKGFTLVMGRYGMTYGKTSLLPYLFGRCKPAANAKTRLDIIIQPSLGSGLLILCTVYILAAVGIYLSIAKGQAQGIIILSLLVVVTYLSMLLKFNKEKKVYLNFIENDLLRS